METAADIPLTTAILQPSGLWVVADDWRQRSSPSDRATLLKQYELIRSEVTTSLQLQQQILGFGIATIGLLAGAAFVSKAETFRSQLLVIFLPLIGYLALTIWLSEVMRMLRAGAFLVTVEKRLDTCGDGSLEWESSLAKDRLGRSRQRAVFARDPDRLRLAAVTVLFFTLGVASIMLGWDGASPFARTFSVVAGVVAATLLRRLCRLRIGEWNDLLEVDAAERDVAFEFRLLRRCRQGLAAVRLPSTGAPRRSSREERDRRLPAPAASTA